MTEAKAIVVGAIISGSTAIIGVAAVIIAAALGYHGLFVQSDRTAAAAHDQFVEDQRRSAYADFLTASGKLNVEMQSFKGASEKTVTAAESLRADLDSLETYLQALRMVSGQGVYDDAVIVHDDLTRGGYSALKDYCDVVPVRGAECVNLAPGDESAMGSYETHVKDLVSIIRHELNIPA